MLVLIHVLHRFRFVRCLIATCPSRRRLGVPHMLLGGVRVGDVVELNTPTAGQTFHVFVYEIAEDEVRYRYGLMGASVGQCLMSDIIRVVGPDEEGISI